MLNVISCFVAAFCQLFFFSPFFSSTLVIYSLQAMCAFCSTQTCTHHSAVQIDFCLNWSLGVTQWKDTWTERRAKRDFYVTNIQVLNHSVCFEEAEFSIFKRPPLETVTGGWIQNSLQLSTTHENSFTSTCAEVKLKFGECCQNISHTWKPFFVTGERDRCHLVWVIKAHINGKNVSPDGYSNIIWIYIINICPCVHVF